MPSINAVDTIQLYQAVKKLFWTLPLARRKTFFPLLALMLVGAGAELLTFGALFPLLTVISGPEGSSVLDWIRPLLSFFGVRTLREEVYALTSIFALTVICSIVIRFFLLKNTHMFVFGCANEISVAIYSGTLAQPYVYHTQHNTSEILSAINKVELVSERVLIPLMTATVAAVISTFMVVGLIFVDPLIAITSAIGFMAIYWSISKVTRGKLGRNGAVIATAQERRVRSMQDGLGSIRDILIDRLQPVFVENYACEEGRLMIARSRNALFANAPRLFIEGIGIILIMIVAVLITLRPGGFIAAVPALGAFALGAQRLLPLTQQMYQGWANSVGGKHLLFDVVELLSRSPLDVGHMAEPLAFENSITLSGVSYSYSFGRRPALSCVDIEISKGARIGIVGATGSGKSTLIDIIIGLLEPTHGEMRVDGTLIAANNIGAWQQRIAHVPQTIFLADASLAENIALGEKKSDIDVARMCEAAEYAQLAEVIAELPLGYETRVGERGIQLSGGQRQRIGIARALYKNANILVFDEATSALDEVTERAVMASVDRLGRNLTIFIIAHRLSTLSGCDMLITLNKGKVASAEVF